MRTHVRRPMAATAVAILIAIAAHAFTAAPGLAQQRTLCVHGLQAPNKLSVRDGPGTNSRVIGHFEADACGVKLAGRCSGDWCQMALDTIKGWVDTRLIGVYEVPAGTKASAATASPAPPRPAAQDSTAPSETVTENARAQDTRVRPREQKVSVARPKPKRSTRAPSIEQGSKAGEEAVDKGACVTDVDRDDTLRIRTGPGVDHDEIGELPPRACGVSISDKCRGNWCRISWRGRKGWVNTNYLD